MCSADIAILQTTGSETPQATSITSSNIKGETEKFEKGQYHMERWMNEKGKEEAWSVHVRF